MDLLSLTDAIRKRADDVYQFKRDVHNNVIDRTPQEQETILNIFLDLVDVSLEEDIRRDVRRTRRLDDVTRGQNDIENLIQELTTERLLSTGEKKIDANDQEVESVDIIHESLILNWQHLRAAVQEQREHLQQRRRFELHVNDWLENQRSDAFLLSGVYLAEGEKLRQMDDVAVQSKDAQEFLNLSIRERDRIQQEEIERQREFAEEQRKRAEAEEARAEEQQKRAEDKEEANVRIQRRARIAIGIGTVAAVLAVIAVFFYYLADRRATAASQGNSRALAAQAESLKDTELDLALLLAVEAKHLADTFAARSSLLSVAKAKPGLLAFLPKHKDTVLDVEFSFDGRMAASAGDLDGTIALWDVLERTQIRTLTGPSNQVFRIVWHPEEPILFSADVKGNVTSWDLSSDDVISRTLYAHPGSVRSLAISLPDGRFLASGSCTLPGWSREEFCESGEIWIWDLVLQERTTPVLSVPFGSVNDLAFSADGHILAPSSCANGDQYGNCNQGEIRLWDIEDGWSSKQVFVGHPDAPLSLAFNPRNPNVLVSSRRGGMIVWDLVNGQSLREYPNPNNFIRSLRFTPDGKQLIGSLCGSFRTSTIFYPECVQGTISVWDYPDDRPTALVRELVGHTDWATDIAIAPDGHTLLSGGSDRRLILWDSEVNQKLMKIIMQQDHAIKDTAISPDDKLLAVGKCTEAAMDRIHCLEGELEIRDLMKNTLLGVLQVPEGGVQSVAFSPKQQANLLATGGCTLDEAGFCQTGEIRLWDAVQQQTLGAFQGHTDFVQTLAFSPDGSQLASGGYDGSVILWDVETHRQLISQIKAFDNFITSVTFSTDGSLLAASSGDGLITLWNTTSGQLHGKLPLNGSNGVMVIAFSPDQSSNLLASGARLQHPPTLWNLDNDEQQLLATAGKAVESLAFNRDGSMLATSSLDGIITLWDMATRRSIGELRIDSVLGSASHLVFDSLGKRLVANTASAVIMWHVDVSVWEQHACQRANRERFTDTEWTKYFGSEEPHNVC